MEVIEIENAQEQNLSVAYGNRKIVLELRYNELLNNWYFNLKENDVYLAYGVTMNTDINLFYDKWQLGKLFLIDTLMGQTEAPIIKSDLGKRLALVREFNA